MRCWVLKLIFNFHIFQGGNEDTVLTFEEDQVQDHAHGVYDPGHSHISKIRRDGGSVENLGNGQTHIDYPKEDETTSSDATGITITGISAGYRFGEETRPKNMRAIFIMRVY